jgi:hypothetical protein
MAMTLVGKIAIFYLFNYALHGLILRTMIVLKNKWMFLLVTIGLMSCEKDKFTTEPQIKYISLTPNSWASDNTNLIGPKLRFQLTDREGDFGWKADAPSYVYIRLSRDSTEPYDSLRFPAMQLADPSNLDAQVEVDITNALPPPHFPRPFMDTLYFDVYVKDRANHVSNILRTPEPFFYFTP